MKVKIGNTVYDSDVTPVCLELSNEEKECISNMGTQTKFSSFPESYWDSSAQCLAWMNFERDPAKIYVYYDSNYGDVAVRSDIDGSTCLHYSTGAMQAVDAQYLYTKCHLVYEELRTNPILFSNFLLPAMIRYKDLCLTRCMVEDSGTISTFGRHFESVATLDEKGEEDFTYLVLWVWGITQSITQTIENIKDKP